MRFSRLCKLLAAIGGLRLALAVPTKCPSDADPSGTTAATHSEDPGYNQEDIAGESEGRASAL